MSVPRQILPGRFYKITRRCTQRQFLLRPDDETNNAFLYCLAEAAARFDIEIIASSAQSNHHHTDAFDRHGHVVEFMEHFGFTGPTLSNLAHPARGPVRIPSAVWLVARH